MPLNQTNKKSIYSLSQQNLENILVNMSLKKYNAKQIFQWLYKKRVSEFDQMSDIAKSSVITLKNNFIVNSLQIVQTQIDPVDKTTKFLCKLDDDNYIETVLMSFDYGYSVCVSTQVGCNMGCKFCASGTLKKVRDLTVDEIVLQVLCVQKYLDKLNSSRISNVVIMGIGEPFDNFENLCNAIDIISNDNGLAIGSRHITVSTCGLIDKIILFAKRFNQIGLAISLHAASDDVRNKLMPINKKYNLINLISACKNYIKITNRRITFEYLLLKEINDSLDDAKLLANLLKDMLCYVNIIVYNPTKNSAFAKSNNIKQFVSYLNEHNINVTIRLERGKRINGACGQLRANVI